MLQSASIQNPNGVLKIDFGSFSTSIGGFVDISIFRKLVELTIRNTNLMTFIDGFSGQSLNLTNASGSPIAFISGYTPDSDINQKIIGLGSVKKIGTGKLSLKGVNSYSGNTEVAEGVLEIATGSLGNGNYAGNILNSSQFSVITTTPQILSGIISGTGIFSVSGDVTLTKNNTYTGQTVVISGGKLSISQLVFGNLTTSAIVNAGILTSIGSVDIRIPCPISGAGDIIQNGTNKLFLSAANTNSGKIQIISGTAIFEKLVSLYNGQTINWTKDKIIVSSGATFCTFVGGTGEFALSDISTITANLFASIADNGFKAGSTIAFDTRNAAGGTFTLSSVIPDSTGIGSGSIGVKKLGANILVLSGTNTFTGQVSVDEGTLSISSFNSELANGQLGPGIQPIKIGSATEGTLLYTGAGNTTNKQIFFDNQGGGIDVQNSAASLILTGIISGSGKFRKLGPGLAELFAANTFSGNLFIQAGTIKVSNSSSLGNSIVSISSGGTIDVINNTTIANNISAEGLGAGNAGAIKISSGSSIIQGTITSTAGFRFSCVGGSSTIQGNITSGGTGNIDIRVSGGSTVTISGLISGATDILNNVGSGNLILSNDSNSFTGRLQLLDANCLVSSIKNYGVPCAVGGANIGAIQIGNAASTATLIYTGTGDSSNRTIQIGRSITNTVGETGGATIKANGSGTLTFAGANFNTPVNITSGVGANRTLTLSGTGQGVISGIIANNTVTAPATGTATISIVKAESGTWTLSGANTFTGTTTVNVGYLVLTHPNALGAISAGTSVNLAASIQLSGGIALAVEPLTIVGSGVAFDGALANLSGANSISSIITMSGNATIHSIAGTLTISGAINGATRNLTLSGAGNLTLSGIITLTTGVLICSGTGTIILSAANVYTGSTSINSGVVRVANASALGTAGAITVVAGGQLEISGVITFARAVTISGIGATSEGSLMNRSGNNTFSGAITLGADSTIGSSVGIFTISGTITGATRNLIFTVAAGAEIVASNQIALTTGTLQKTGTGTLTLSGTTSTYTGTTSVLQGILRITSFSSFGTSSEVIVGSGATLQIQPAVTGTLSKLTTISGNGVSNQGALNNTALSNIIGPGVLKVGSSASNKIASASALTLTINGITRNESLLAGAPAPLTFGGAGTITLTGIISTTGTSGLSSLVKVDAGTLNLGNLAHVYNGSTTISAGTLTRSVVAGATTATGSFTAGTTLNVTFAGPIPAIGSTWKFFPADTTNTYSAVVLTGATGRTGSYNKTTSTLTIS